MNLIILKHMKFFNKVVKLILSIRVTSIGVFSFVALSLIVSIMGCSLLGYNNDKSAQPSSSNASASSITDNLASDETTEASKSIIRFSEYDQLPITHDRKYRKMTRQRMEEESDLQSHAGSMWMMDGQSSYLFSQNKSRKEGDLLTVKIEAGAQKQIDLKVRVIKKLLAQLEEQELKQRQVQDALRLAAEGKTVSNDKKDRSPSSMEKPVLNERNEKTEKNAKNEKDEGSNIDFVPSRIVERLPDGNYRIKGTQPFMIGKREYKVIVTGLIRPEDFNDSGIGSGILVDPQYDVVSLRRKTE